MSLTSAQREAAALYTGRSTFEDNGDLQRSLNALNPAAETVVARILNDCQAVDEQIQTFVPKLALAIADGTKQIRGAYTLGTLQALGRSHSGRLCGYLALGMGSYDPWASALPVATPPPPL